jgi:hypothetical protein
MAQLALSELLKFLQQKPTTYKTPIVFNIDDSKIKDYVLKIFFEYKKKFFFENLPITEVKDCSKVVVIQKSVEARKYLPVLSIGIVETSGLDFNKHLSDFIGWPGYSTKLVVNNFPKKLHLLAKLHNATEIYYYHYFAIRWGPNPYQVIDIKGITKGILIESKDEEVCKDENLINLQFVPEGQSKTLSQMTPDELIIHHPCLKALIEVLKILEFNGLIKD